jgi:uncharacterized protein with von Willebrand factor type A (vWA) domain
MISVGARDSAPGMETFVKNGLSPQAMDRFGEKEFKDENGYLSAAGNHGHLSDGRAFENDV